MVVPAIAARWGLISRVRNTSLYAVSICLVDRSDAYKVDRS